MQQRTSIQVAAHHTDTIAAMRYHRTSVNSREIIILTHRTNYQLQSVVNVNEASVTTVHPAHIQEYLGAADIVDVRCRRRGRNSVDRHERTQSKITHDSARST